MSFTLCSETGAKAMWSNDANYNECPVHRTDECLETYVKADEEYWKSLESRRTYVKVNELSVRQLRKAKDELTKALAWISQPRESIMGRQPPLVKEPALADADPAREGEVKDGVCLICGGGVLNSGEHIDPDRHIKAVQEIHSQDI